MAQAIKQTRRFIRLPEVLDRVGLKRTQVFELMNDGRFPRSVRVGKRAVAWIEDEIERFQEERIADRDAKS